MGTAVIIFALITTVWFLLGYVGLKLLVRKGYEPGEGSRALREDMLSSSAYVQSDPGSKGTERAFEVQYSDRFATASYAVAGPLLLLVALILPKKKRHYLG